MHIVTAFSLEYGINNLQTYGIRAYSEQDSSLF
jgi:hypothetical protein